MRMELLRGIFKSIIVLVGAIMLLCCKNDMEEVNKLGNIDRLPEMSGNNLEMIYSDSARIKYKVSTPRYVKMNQDEDKYDEFPQGIHVISYDRDGKVMGEITARYAKKLEKENLWEAREQVVVINGDGAKLETDLLYWDMTKERIYSDRYSKLTANGDIIESSEGFESDQNLKNPIFKNITDGKVEVEL
ncbi:LPS export ABC transporter periplasmic protein LptC [Odoribacter lunatus]|uniref:LPS export ABC transporter periplasmic protein LptC n=1 Tax=Odoribacter lunatus TaxID=2941335 RepID=UPI00203C7DEA|nr:LPS export ABC transporter periplasmic protein LptC [Odoribacter lunatus]